MRILVTGASGFVGSNVAARLIREGHEVFVHGRDGEQPFNERAAKVVKGDLGSIDMDEVGHIDALVHQAAIADTMMKDEDEMMRVNVEIPKRLFEQVVANGSQKIIYASSTAVYGDLPTPYREDGPVKPLNAYARSKALLDTFAMEFAAAHSEVRVVGLRYCNVYGPGESHKKHMASMVYRLAQQMRTGDPQLFNYGEQEREFMYVDDIAEANVRALEAKESCILNCATGHPRTFNDLVGILNAALKTKRMPNYIDNPLSATYQSHIACDVSRIRDTLGFTAAYSLEDGVEAYSRSGTLGA